MTTHFTAPQAIFDNRRDAGRQLAAKLREYSEQSVVVLAIPNGGVPVALEVASALNADLDLVICHRIPLSLKSSFGAIADDGTIFLNEAAVKKNGLSQQQIEYEANKVRAEIKQRSLLYRGDRPLVRVNGEMVIIIDDGLASGYTMMAAVESVRHRHPKEIVVAVPVTSALALEQVEKIVDKVVTCATGFMLKFSVTDFYRDWNEVSDNEVIRCFNQWRMRRLR